MDHARSIGASWKLAVTRLEPMPSLMELPLASS
jgi:hypothetical protein